MSQMRIFAFVVAIVLSVAAFAAPTAPPGWRFPGTGDINGGWEEYRDYFPIPYLARGDMNGDGRTDEVWILLPTTGQGLGLFVFLAKSKPGEYRVIELISDNESTAQWYAVVSKPPGKYLTWCGKGAEECDEDEPKSITLKHYGFEFHTLGQAGGLYYWNARKRMFESVTTSD